MVGVLFASSLPLALCPVLFPVPLSFFNILFIYYYENFTVIYASLRYYNGHFALLAFSHSCLSVCFPIFYFYIFLYPSSHHELGFPLVFVSSYFSSSSMSFMRVLSQMVVLRLSVGVQEENVRAYFSLCSYWGKK